MAKRTDKVRSAKEWRKFVPYYFKGMAGVKDLKLALLQAENSDALMDLINKNL